MGAKTWMLVLADSNARGALAAKRPLDRGATQNLADTLFPGEKLKQIGDGDLSYTCPPDDEVHIGCFPGVSVVAAKEFGIDYPSKLHHRFIAAGGNGTVTLHAMHSVVDWFAYASWANGKLVRSLSLSPDSGIMEDIGQRLPFEEPYWSGAHPAVDSEEAREAARATSKRHGKHVSRPGKRGKRHAMRCEITAIATTSIRSRAKSIKLTSMG